MVNRHLCRIGSTALAYEHFGRIIRGVGGVASGSGPGAFLSEILKKIRSHANRADAAAISRSGHATAVLVPPMLISP
jgi:hypothetical protein